MHSDRSMRALFDTCERGTELAEDEHYAQDDKTPITLEGFQRHGHDRLAAARLDGLDQREAPHNLERQACLGAVPPLLATGEHKASTCHEQRVQALARTIRAHGRGESSNDNQLRIQASDRTTRAYCRVGGHRRQTPRRPKALGGAVTATDVAVLSEGHLLHAQRTTRSGAKRSLRAAGAASS
jgi:hypothetical protein